jgi:hypothetical protein
MLDEQIAVAAARNYRRLRGKEVTIRKPIDLIIGTCCMRIATSIPCKSAWASRWSLPHSLQVQEQR